MAVVQLCDGVDSWTRDGEETCYMYKQGIPENKETKIRDSTIKLLEDIKLPQIITNYYLSQSSTMFS